MKKNIEKQFNMEFLILKSNIINGFWPSPALPQYKTWLCWKKIGTIDAFLRTKKLSL